MTDKKSVKFIDMVKGLTILCIALYHIIAPGAFKFFLGGVCAVLFFSSLIKSIILAAVSITVSILISICSDRLKHR